MPADELAKAKAYISGGLELRMEETRHLASWIGGQEALHDRVLTLDEALAAVAGGHRATTCGGSPRAVPRRAPAPRRRRTGAPPPRPRPAPAAARMTEPRAGDGPGRPAAQGRRQRAGRPATPGEATGRAEAAAPPAASDPRRPTGLLLAHVHLRLGSLSLARAELEAYAGRSALDDAALLDLAEARWRTGDLAGAGEAANAFLATGRSDALGLVIAAEAVAALGRPGEARRLAGRALEAIEGPLDPLFAGMPRSLIWPADAPPDAEPATLGAAAAPPPPADASPGPATASPARSGTAPVPPGDAADLVPSGAPLPPALVGGTAPEVASGALAAGRLALERGDLGPAAVRLGLALRLDPRLAAPVLETLGPRPPADPGLALVTGDALRLLGREEEALHAFARAGETDGGGAGA